MYVVGQRSTDPAHFGSARDTTGQVLKTDDQVGKEPLPKGGSVAVGRTLMTAVGMLYDGEVVETADASKASLIEAGVDDVVITQQT